MQLENMQLLSTAHHLLAPETIEWRDLEDQKKPVPFLNGERVYRATHPNHPSAVWVRSSKAAYDWAAALSRALSDEYTLRYGKIHASSLLLSVLDRAPDNIPVGIFSPPPQCMPVHCKIEGDSIAAYRNYYRIEKARFATWKAPRETPEWMK